MYLWNLTKLFFKIFTLRAKASDIPYSQALLLVLSIIFVLTKTGVYIWFVRLVDQFDSTQALELSYFGAFEVSVFWLLVLVATLRTALIYYKMVGRFVQLACAFVTVDLILTAIFALWLCGLSIVNIPSDSANLGSIAIIIGFVLMMYWQFMVYIHLLVYGMNLTILKAGVFALVYMLLQQNLAELMLNGVIIVQ